MWWPRLKLLGLLIFEPAPRYFRHGLARIFSAANLTVFSIRFALLVEFAQRPFLDSGLGRVHQGFILRDVFLLYLGYLGVNLAQFRAAVLEAVRLIKIVSLLLTGHQRQDVRL
jgi:hypothetical protein